MSTVKHSSWRWRTFLSSYRTPHDHLWSISPTPCWAPSNRSPVFCSCCFAVSMMPYEWSPTVRSLMCRLLSLDVVLLSFICCMYQYFIPSCRWAAFHWKDVPDLVSSVHLLMNTRAVSIFWLLWIKFLWAFFVWMYAFISLEWVTRTGVAGAYGKYTFNFIGNCRKVA